MTTELNRENEALNNRIRSSQKPLIILVLIIVLLIAGLGVIYQHEEQSKANALHQARAANTKYRDALAEITDLNKTKQQLLTELGNKNLTPAQRSFLLAQVKAIVGQTTTIAKQGEPGPAGASGAQGLAGLPGSAGANGKNGENGVNGANGRDSTVPGPMSTVTPSPGAKGDKGDKGDPGDPATQAPPECPTYRDNPFDPGYQWCERPSPTPEPSLTP